MLKIDELAPPDAAPAARLVLTYDERTKRRHRVRLDDGTEAALVLPRGTVLRPGDRLRADDGRVIEVVGAPETLSVVETDDPLLLARAAYHLGNRHVALQIRPGSLRYQHDHVLDGMARALGLAVRVEQAAFEPEGGAYGHGGGGHHGPHHHHGDGDHGHGHGHEHER